MSVLLVRRSSVFFEMQSRSVGNAGLKIFLGSRVRVWWFGLPRDGNFSQLHSKWNSFGTVFWLRINQGVEIGEVLAGWEDFFVFLCFVEMLKHVL